MFLPALYYFSNTVSQEPVDGPADGRQTRPRYKPGIPDYACPKVVNENIRLSIPNRRQVLPAGIRKQDFVLPLKFEVRDQPRFMPNGRVLRVEQFEPKVLHARANTADQFVVTGMFMFSLEFVPLILNTTFFRSSSLSQGCSGQLYEVPAQEAVHPVSQAHLRWSPVRPRQGQGAPQRQVSV